MLGLENPIHILFLLVIVLLVFGAKRLPEMGKSLGEGMRGFKDSISGAPHAAEMTADPSLTPLAELTAAPVTAAPVPHVAAAAPVAPAPVAADAPQGRP